MAITVNGAPAAVLQVSADLAATISDESGTLPLPLLSP